jgi:catechol 2,3-dioxygenase-like lactoylglutathione lyase family enzyme
MSMDQFEVGAVMATADMNAAREFYEDKLGLKPNDAPGDDAEIVTYVCGKGTGISVYVSPDHAGKSTATLAGWVVDDVEKVVDELTSRGVSFERYDGIAADERGIADMGAMRCAWITDPDGNSIGISQLVAVTA